MSFNDCMMNPNLENWLKRGFINETDFDHGSPSASYFWYRKRDQLKQLIIRNQDLIKNRATENSTFVDLGCDTGVDLFLFHDLFKKLGISFNQFVGVDGDPIAQEIFSHRQKFSQKDIRFVFSDLTELLPFSDKSIDMLCCSEILEHMPDPTKFCAELNRVTKPGALLLLTTPNEPNVFQKNYWLPGSKKRMEQLREKLLKEGLPVTQDGKSFQLYNHVSLQTCQTCDHLLQTAGFRLVNYRRGAIRYGGTPWHDSPFTMVLYFFIESVLDLLPLSLTRTFSDQIIALYEKT